VSTLTPRTVKCPEESVVAEYELLGDFAETLAPLIGARVVESRTVPLSVP
jgi:hypothetical protein